MNYHKGRARRVRRIDKMKGLLYSSPGLTVVQIAIKMRLSETAVRSMLGEAIHEGSVKSYRRVGNRSAQFKLTEKEKRQLSLEV